jgi:arylsulfatase A-like enzyme
MKVLVIVANGLSVGSMGCYGNEWAATPALDLLAAEGVVFDQHYADEPTALGAVRAWRTGRFDVPETASNSAHYFAHLQSHDIRTGLITPDQDSSFASLGWDLVRQIAGDATGHEAVVGEFAELLSSLHSLPHYLIRMEYPIPSRAPDALEEPSKAAALCETDGASSMDQEELDGQEELDPEDQEILNADLEYDARLSQFDEALGTLFEECRLRGLLDDALIIVTADYGRTCPAGAGLHEELVHIPLLVRFPDRAQAGRRIRALTQTVDLLPTVFDFFGADSPTMQGYSLLPLSMGKVEAIRPYAFCRLRTFEQTACLLRSPDWSFQRKRRAADSIEERRLYVKPDDRWEVNDVYQHHQDYAEQLERTMHSFIEAARQPGAFQPPELPQPETQSLSAAMDVKEPTP